MSVRKAEYCEVEGITIPKFLSKECFQSALRYQPKPDDIFVVTYPKCGTTWMQNVVLNILRRAEPLDKPQDFFLASPFLDQLGAEDSERMMIRPGAYKTHLPFGKVPWSDDAKYIYVARNPKDCCVSFYHHKKQLPGYQFSEATFGEFFEQFIAGELEFGDYFAHLTGWYNQRHKSNILFVAYEEMKGDLKNAVLRVADFIKPGEARHLRENANVLTEILHNCSLEEMKFINTVLNCMHYDVREILRDPKVPRGRKHIVAYNATLPPCQRQKITLVRKGEIGGWKMMFTEDQNKRMNEKIKTIEHCNDVMSLWRDIM